MSESRVDQTFFGWSPQEQRLTMMASSFATEDEARYWLHKLEAHVRLQPVPPTRPPAAAMSYFRFDDYAAVLRRVGTGASAGRNNSHALVAPAGMLTPEVALGLAFWTDWEEQPPESSFMSALSFEALKSGVPPWVKKLSDPVARCGVAIELVLAKYLEDPSRPLSVVGVHDRDRLTVVWALRELVERYVQPPPRTMPDWTFSTYEDRHDVTVEDLPFIVFLPAMPQSGTVRRGVMDLGVREVRPEDLARAHKLVRCLTGGAEPPEPLPTGETTGGEPNSGGHEGPPPGPKPPRTVKKGAKEAVAVLNDARHLGDFLRQLERLEKNATAATRPSIRAALDVPAMNLAARFVEVDIRRELLQRLLAVAYGPRLADLADDAVERHAAKLLRETTSDQLAMMIGGDEHLLRPSIREAVIRRWSAERSVPSERAGRLARRLRASSLSRALPWAATAAVVAVVAVVFLCGYLVGRPGPEAGGALGTGLPGSAAATSIAPTESAAVGTIALATVPGQLAFAFNQIADDFYPVGACTPATAGVWRCPLRPAPGPGAPATPVVVVVPQEQASDLSARAQRHEKMQRGDGWGDPSPIG